MQDKLSGRAGLWLLAVIALLLVLATAWWRPDIRNPSDDASFFRMKLAWREAADVVVLGNSQVYRGIDTQAFAEQCPGVSTLNFGFSGVLMRASYVEASLPVLRRDGAKLLLVGINPLQFKSERLGDGFVETRRHDAQFRLPWKFEAKLQPLLARLRPLEQPLPAAKLVHWEYRPDGFVASDSPAMTIQPARYARYANSYVANPFSEKMYRDLLEQLVRLKRSGYRVMVFPTYSSPQFELIDARMSGLDDARLEADSRRLGLDFLPLAVDGLRSYDGTHLDAHSAAIFSRRLGQAVNARSAICGGGRDSR